MVPNSPKIGPEFTNLWSRNHLVPNSLGPEFTNWPGPEFTGSRIHQHSFLPVPLQPGSISPWSVRASGTKATQILKTINQWLQKTKRSRGRKDHKLKNLISQRPFTWQKVNQIVILYVRGGGSVWPYLWTWNGIWMNKQLSHWLIFIERKSNGPLSLSTGYQKFKLISPFGSLKILANFHPCTYRLAETMWNQEQTSHFNIYLSCFIVLYQCCRNSSDQSDNRTFFMNVRQKM